MPANVNWSMAGPIITGSKYRDAATGRPGARIRITDPTAYAVNWQLLAQKPNDPHYTNDDAYPAAVDQIQAGTALPL